jgi:hypothetical protein
MNVLHESIGYVYALDPAGKIELLNEAGVLERLRSQIGKDTALAQLRRTEIPFDHEQGRFEFLFRAKPMLDSRSSGRVKCRQQMARSLALLALRKSPSILYVTVDYSSWTMTLVRDASPTSICGTVATFDLAFVKAMQAGVSGIVSTAFVTLGLEDPGRKLAPVSAPRESPVMEL